MSTNPEKRMLCLCLTQARFGVTTLHSAVQPVPMCASPYRRQLQSRLIELSQLLFRPLLRGLSALKE